jgi:hypothetical protein
MNSDALPPDVQATTAVPLLASRYQLLDKLGQGGMGTVFRARDGKLDRPVAVKILPTDSIHDAEAVARFQREAKALARLSHPGIIQAFDSGEDGDKHFLVMELVEGHSLARELSQQGRIAPTRAADHAHQAALALHHAHQHGLIHRDVKPSNLLLSADGRVKLLDLGLARFLQDQVGDANLTREGTGMGTPDYAAPEQFRDAHHADPRSDVYSLGCTLYHLIAGRVPFPGSSMSEKVKAHETTEPPPLEELCPEVPGGLALAVQRMMAKRPADRFQSMAEVAEALAPYVAGSSASFRQIRNASTWTGAQLATMPAIPRRRARVAWLVAGLAAVLVLAAVGVVGWTAGWFRSHEPVVAQSETPPTNNETGTDKRPAETAPAMSEGGSKKEEPKKEEPRDPNVLTVAQKEGAAQYQTIFDALANVKAGQTVRVLDNGIYKEFLQITDRTNMAGLTLEATGGATLALESAGAKSFLMVINSVANVTVRGFHLRVKNTPQSSLIVVRGDCRGLRLEQLEMAATASPATNGVEVYGLAAAAPEQAPAVIRDCTFHGFAIGTIFAPAPGHSFFRTAVRDCLFTDCFFGVQVSGGGARDIQVVGNRFRGMKVTAVQFLMIAEDTENILLANNTIVECAAAFRIWDSAIHGKHVQFRNNLILRSEGMDMLVVDAINYQETRGPGDGAAVAKTYRISHNWRQGHELTGADAKGWIPPDPKKGDVLAEKIDGISTSDAKSPDFLRPDPKSKLATDGAGNEDPSLPRYVGALPPEGTEAWDWDRTWRMPKEAQLLTVSKESSGGGKYRAINEALKEARPWATIRVLDGATYSEAISLTDRKKHEGLTLEAVGGAKLHLTGGPRRLVTISDVPYVRMTGFQLTENAGLFDPTAASRAFVTVNGNVPGVALTRLNLTPKAVIQGFVLQNSVATAEEPLRIENCTVRPSSPLSNDGISVVGNLDQDPTRGICLRSNRIFNSLHGIVLHGTLSDIHIVGNLTLNCPACGIQLEDLSPRSRGILIANNTVLGGERGFCLWDNAPYEEPVAGQVEGANNLIWGASTDMAYVFDPGKGQSQTPGDGKALVKLWRFHDNRRDFAADKPPFAIPADSDDDRLRPDDLLTQDANEPDRLRPGKDSSLATHGAGRKDNNLPLYIGALPPEGISLWDWDRTWRARVKKAEDKKDRP